MKILIICSKNFYINIPPIKEELEKMGHSIYLPNSYDNPSKEAELRGTKEHAIWKAKMIKKSEERIKELDAVLVLNMDKGESKNYIGGATFLEIYDAFRFNKKVFLYNDIPDGMLKDEIIGFSPIVINKDLSKVK